jgi:hypothetical protein
MISDTLWDAIDAIRSYLDDPRLSSYYSDATRKELEIGLAAMDKLACVASVGAENSMELPSSDDDAAREPLHGDCDQRLGNEDDY